MNTALENIEIEINNVNKTIEEAVVDKDWNHAHLMRAKLDGLTIAKKFVEADEISEIKPTRMQKGWIKKANKYLHFEQDGSDQAVLNVIAAIRDHKDQTATVDIALGYTDDVFVIEKFEYNFTCKDFLVLIGYHSK